MKYFTCNNCNYTFAMKTAPESCPDCGKRVAKRVISNGSFALESTVPAIRPASEAEVIWFRRVQAELAAELVWVPA